MTRSIHSILSIFLLVALSCGGSKGPGQDPQGGTGAAGGTAAGFLGPVPADTPYLYALVEPIPTDYLEGQLRRVGLAYGDALERFVEFREKNPKAFADLEMGHRLIVAMLEEVRGRLSVDGMGELGFDPQGRVAIYGLGLFPALRMELADGPTFKAMLERVFAAARLTAPVAKHGDRDYWSFEVEGVTVVAAVSGNMLLAAVVSPGELETTLPLMFGEKKPAKSLADTDTVRALSDQFGFNRGFLGYVDSARLSDLGLKLAGIDDPTCKSEIAGLASSVPRLVFGSTSFVNDTFSGKFVFETRADITNILRSAGAAVPSFSPDEHSKAIMSWGMGADVDAILESIQGKFTKVSQAPYKCPLLDELNQGAQAVPAMIKEFRQSPFHSITGFNVIVRDVKMAFGVPTGIDGALIVGSKDPGALLKAAAAELPDLAKKPIVPGAKPVKIDLPGMMSMAGPAHIATSPDAIGVSLGANAVDLLELLKVAPGAGGPVFAMRVDGKFVADAFPDPNIKAVEGASPELAKALKQAKVKTASDVTVTGSVSDLGLAFEFAVTPSP